MFIFNSNRSTVARNRREEKEAADQQLTDERHRFFRQLSTHVTDNSSIGQTSAPPQCTVDWLHALTTPPPPSVLEQSSNEIRALHPTPDYIARLPDDDYPLTVKSATVMPPCMGDCNPCNLVDGGGCGGGQGDHGFSIAVSTRALTSFRPCQMRTHTYEYPCMSQIQALWRLFHRDVTVVTWLWRHRARSVGSWGIFIEL